MAATASSVKAVGGSAFSGLADATVTTWIAIAERRISESIFGDDYDDAVTFYTLHALASTQLNGAGAGGAAGSVSSVKVGSVSVGFASPNQDDWLETTAWGRMFKQLRDSQVTGFAVADVARDV